MNTLIRGLFLCLALTLAACVAMPERVVPGATRAQIETELGRPTAEYPLPDGVRLQYSFQPMGRYVYNLDLGADGVLRRNEQVLDIRWMRSRILIDQWTREDVLRHMGRPALVERVALFEGDVWMYRYLENNLERTAHVHIDRAGVVRKLVFLDEYSPPPDRS